MDWVKKSDVEFKAQMDALLAYMVANEVALGFADLDFANIEAARVAFNASLADADAAKAAAGNAVAAKEAARGTLEGLIRPVIMQIQVNPAVTNETRTAAGIPVRDTVRTFSAPISPLGLVATQASPVSARLVWNSNGNASGVQYVIEKRVNNAGEWLKIDVVTATRYLAQGLTPGVRVDFRVKARRGAQTSDPSNTASIYAD
jgi:hypothetical protein